MLSKLKRAALLLLIIVLCSGAAIACSLGYTNAETVERSYVYYELDTGVVFLWCNAAGKWQNGIVYGNSGSKYELSHSFSLPEGAVQSAIYAYDGTAKRGEAGYFPFSDTVSGEYALWARPKYGKNKSDYDAHYLANSAEMKTLSTDGLGSLYFRASFPNGCGIDLKEALSAGRKDYIYDLLGDPSDELIKLMNLLSPESESYSAGVKGYMVFLPTVVVYTITESVEIPGGGEGPDKPDEPEKPDKPDEPDPPDKPDEPDPPDEPDEPDGPGEEEKRIDSARAILNLPESCYVGHPVSAVDASLFELDGEYLSAAEVYRSKLASSGMSSNAEKYESSWVGSGKTEKRFVFWESGLYTVTLSVKLKGSGERLYDTKEILVLDCPDIRAELSGRQRENRKQSLFADIATDPRSPLKYVKISLSLEDGGEAVELLYEPEAEGVLCNSELIKTRPIALVSADAYSSALRLDFLTKNRENARFKYHIYAEDRSGKSCEAEAFFTVEPDEAPLALLSVEKEQLREAGTNTAKIALEDLSTADSGDSLRRRWYAREEGVSAWTFLNNSEDIEDFSFGKLQSIIHSKEGVGKIEYRLEVRDIWEDETLEEYIGDKDYLSSHTVAETEVINIAPTVSLELKNAVPARLLFLSGSAEANERLSSLKGTLKRALLEENIDSEAAFDTLPAFISEDETGEAGKGAEIVRLTTGGLNWRIYNTFFESDNYAVDEDSLYYIAPNYDASAVAANDNKAYPTQPFEISAYDGVSGELKWQSSLSSDMLDLTDSMDRGGFVSCKGGGYIFFSGSEKSAVFSKESGAFLKRLNFVPGDDCYLYSGSIYSPKADGVYRISAQNAKVAKICDMPVFTKGGSSLRGSSDYSYISDDKLVFLSKSRIDGKPCICKFSLSDGSLLEIPLNADLSENAVYSCLGFDSDGSCALLRDEDGKLKSFVFDRGGKLLRSFDCLGDCFAVYDLYGRFSHLAYSKLGSNSSKSRRICSVSLCDIASGKVLSASVSASSSPSSGNTIAALRYGNKLGVVMAGSEIGIADYSRDASERTYHFDFDLESGECEVSTRSDDFSYIKAADYTESSRSSGELFASGHTLNGFSPSSFNGDIAVKLVNIQKSADQALYSRVARHFLRGEQGEEEKILVLCDDVLSRSGDIRESAEAICSAGLKCVFLHDGYGLSAYMEKLRERLSDMGCDVALVSEGEGLPERLAAAVSELSAVTYRDYVEVAKESQASESRLERELELECGRTYFYDFSADTDALRFESEISVEKDELEGSSESGVVYLVSAFESENFISGELNPFFSFERGAYGVKNGSYCPVDFRGINQGSKRYKSAESNISFTVPEGKRAVLSFEYEYLSGNDSEITLSVDGRAWSGLSGSSSSGTYFHNAPLESGEHTINVSIAEKARVLLSYFAFKQIRISYIEEHSGYFDEEAQRLGFLRKSCEISEAGDGIYRYRGSFNLPSGPSFFLAAKGVKADAGAEYYKRHRYFIDKKNGFICVPGDSCDGGVKLALSSSLSSYRLYGFKLYALQSNREQLFVKLEDDVSEETADFATLEGASAEKKRLRTEREEEEAAPLFFAKGELVRHEVFYSDYEGDPSKAQYWRYTHTPLNDGAHPDAAFIEDRYGNVKAGSGGILSEPIERFYIDGKYVLEHWQYDDCGNELYDRPSNTAVITFYIVDSAPTPPGGGGDEPGEEPKSKNTPPRVERLFHLPEVVEEGDGFSITAEVSDREHDELVVLLELYFDGQKIYEGRDNHFGFDEASGKYPAFTSGTLPDMALAGTYTAVCTVSDESGFDMKSHSFKVEPKPVENALRASVYHGENWEKKRRTYNTNNFGRSFDGEMSLSEYLSGGAPRPRGSNVFWSGERFMLKAYTLGNALRVNAKIQGSDFSAELYRTGDISDSGESVFAGDIWDSRMLSLWSGSEAVPLSFLFTAYYDGGDVKSCICEVIADGSESAEKLHRKY